jgi:hemoglobin
MDGADNIASLEALVVRRAVDQFYLLVLADQQLAPYFIGTDLRRMKGYLTTLLTEAVCGTEPVRAGDEIVAAHAGMGLTEDDYDRIGHYLLTTLLRLRVGVDALIRVGGVLADVRDPILYRTTRTGRLAHSA